MVDIAFRALAAEDLEMVGSWLRTPHVAVWWRTPSIQEEVVAKYLPRIRGDEPTEMFVVMLDGDDVGLIQRYRNADNPIWDEHLRATGMAPSPSAGIDYLLGDSRLTGRGVGSEVIKSFSAELLDEWVDIEAVIACPQEANVASCRALAKAGYELVWIGDVGSGDPSDEGPSAVYVLRRQPSRG